MTIRPFSGFLVPDGKPTTFLDEIELEAVGGWVDGDWNWQESYSGKPLSEVTNDLERAVDRNYPGKLAAMERVIANLQGRGHTLSPFVYHDFRRHSVKTAVCVDCGANIVLDANPPPNGIDYSGGIYGPVCDYKYTYRVNEHPASGLMVLAGGWKTALMLRDGVVVGDFDPDANHYDEMCRFFVRDL